VGGHGFNSSGDLFLAFATGNAIPVAATGPIPLTMVPQARIDPFLLAAAEATEEAILNALTGAETLIGQRGRVAHALPLERLQALMAVPRT